MSPAGGFLVCRDCKLNLHFSERAEYGVIAQAFDLHSCGSAARRIVIVRYEGKVPVMASCSKCEHKFFTPTSIFKRDAVGAEQYLVYKFDLHCCEEPKI